MWISMLANLINIPGNAPKTSPWSLIVGGGGWVGGWVSGVYFSPIFRSFPTCTQLRSVYEFTDSVNFHWSHIAIALRYELIRTFRMTGGLSITHRSVGGDASCTFARLKLQQTKSKPSFLSTSPFVREIPKVSCLYFIRPSGSCQRSIIIHSFSPPRRS